MLAQELTSGTAQVGAPEYLRCLLGSSSGQQRPTLPLWEPSVHGGRAAQVKRAPGQLGKRPQCFLGADRGLPLCWGFVSQNPARWACITPAHCTVGSMGAQRQGCEGHQVTCSCPVPWCNRNIFSWALPNPPT